MMCSFTRSLIFLAFIHIFVNLISCNSEEIVSIRLNNGVINGKIETSSENKKINVFKGIPYAEPPIGDLRFRKPQPLKQWPKNMNAFEWGNTCYQTKLQPEAFDKYYNKNLSEDCLFLNIMSPEDSLNIEELRPVIVYIHGGGLLIGSGGWIEMDMKELTARGDVVTVSINYRLTTFGFLYSGTEDAPGNVGLWDQALALEWVNDNIRYFGGDPKRVTIMGQSAGGWSISLHVLSPISRNLFQNAILQSGSYVDHMINGETDHHIKRWLKGAQMIGCNDNKITDKFTPEIIECLKKVDPDELSVMADNMTLALSAGFYPFVVVDGQFLPNKPTEMLRSGDFKKKVNILFGTVADEGSFYLLWHLPEFSNKNITYEEAYQALREFAQGASSKAEVNGEDVAKLYLSGLSGSTDSNLLKQTVSIAIGDLLLGCAPILFAKEVFRNSDFKANVYQYHWNRKVEASGESSFGLPEWAGPKHGGDCQPTHGIPFVIQKDFPDRERERSQQMMRMVIDFARTGKPTPEGGEEWPKYYAIDDNIIAPFYEFTQTPKSDTNFGVGLKINECEYLWKKYLM